MKLTLDFTDLKENMASKKVMDLRFDDFNEKAQKIILVAGEVEYRSLDGSEGLYIYPPKDGKRTVPAENFLSTVAVNVDNNELKDSDFRQFIRNTLPIIIFHDPREYSETEDSECEVHNSIEHMQSADGTCPDCGER